MTTIQDNTIEATPHEAKANGAHANGTKTRAPRKAETQRPVPDAVDAIMRRRAATCELETELKSLESRKTEILAELGIGELIAGKLETTTRALSKVRARSTKTGGAPRVKAAASKPGVPKKARAKRATEEEMSAAKATVYGCISSAVINVDAATIAAFTRLPKSTVTRALKALRSDEKISVTGKNKGMRYAVK